MVVQAYSLGVFANFKRGIGQRKGVILLVECQIIADRPCVVRGGSLLGPFYL